MTAYLVPKDTREIQNFLVTWLNTNLVDPYEQATSKTRSTFVYGDDFKMSGNPPVLHVDVNDFKADNIVGQSGVYLDEETHQIVIYYYCQRDHRFTFADNGLTLTNEAQCRKYLQYVKDQLKVHMSDFAGYLNNVKFGTIPKPTLSQQSGWFVSMLPLTTNTYRR
jgi:hypothetical protein